MGVSRQAGGDSGWRHGWFAVLVSGALMQIWFWLRSVWIYLDQVELYELGMVLVRDGKLLPFGKLSTGDLPIPGVVLELLVGLPLLIWRDLRASTLVLVLFHFAAAVMVSRLLARDFGWRLATIYLAVFWLSPWRLFHSAFLWETNYLVLPAALHFLACRALRTEAKLGASALLGATLVLTAQIHGSVLILVVGCVVLLLRHLLFVNWWGAALGGVLGSIPLIPTAMALIGGSGLPTQPESAAGLLVRLNSLEKGLFYWFRLGSLDVGRRFRQSLFCLEPGGGDTVPEPMLCHLVEITQILALASVLITVVASSWFLRRSRANQGNVDSNTTQGWYRDYCLAMFLAVLVASLLSPVLIQGWHVLIVLPIACLPPAVWISHRWPTAGSALRAVIVLFVLWRIPASLLLLGHPMYAKPETPDLPRHIAPVELRVLVPD